MGKSGESGGASFDAKPSQYPRTLYDDPVKKDWKPELRMDLYGVVASDIHGRSRDRLELEDPDQLPQTRFGLLRERCRNERRVEQLVNSPAAAVFWDAVVDEDARCTEDEELALRLFIVRDEDGKVAVDDHVKWPKHETYAEVARQLHFIDPVRFKNKEGGVPSREVTKGLVLDGFARKHLSMLQKYDAKPWTYDEVWEQAEYYFGEPWKKTSHGPKAGWKTKERHRTKK